MENNAVFTNQEVNSINNLNSIVKIIQLGGKNYVS